LNDQYAHYQAKPQVKAWTQGTAGGVLFDPDRNQTRYLNPTGLDIWRRLATPVTTARLAEALAEAFEDAPAAELLTDVADFLAELCREQFCTRLDESIAPAGHTGETGLPAVLPDAADGPGSVDISLTAGCTNQSSICLRPEQQVQAMRTLHRLAGKYPGRVTAMAGPLAKWRMYHEMEQARATGEQTRRWRMGYLTACGCVFNKLSVHHDGTITPCNLLAELELGRIHRDSLSVIWKTHPTLAALKARRSIPMQSVPGCEDCEWAPFCNGSCPGLAYELTGEIHRANPHDCYRRFIRETGVRCIPGEEEPKAT